MLLFILMLTMPFTILGWIHQYKLPKKTNLELVAAWTNALLYIFPVVNILMYIAENEHTINDWLKKERK